MYRTVHNLKNGVPRQSLFDLLWLKILSSLESTALLEPVNILTFEKSASPSYKYKPGSAKLLKNILQQASSTNKNDKEKIKNLKSQYRHTVVHKKYTLPLQKFKYHITQFEKYFCRSLEFELLRSGCRTVRFFKACPPLLINCGKIGQQTKK